jgi:pyrroline-5-carboxylate reductase
MGLPREQANRLAAQTVLGAGSMVLTNKVFPTQLKDNVTSPAGNSITNMYHHSA